MIFYPALIISYVNLCANVLSVNLSQCLTHYFSDLFHMQTLAIILCPLNLTAIISCTEHSNMLYDMNSLDKNAHNKTIKLMFFHIS